MKANRAPRRRALRADAAGVTDVLGSILLVGVTVAMAAGLGLLLLALDGPTDLQHTDLAVSVDPGADGKWQGEAGDIDSEQVRVTHIGGEPLSASGVEATLRVGNATSQLTGTQLAAAFGAGPTFTLGEVWAANQSIARNTSVALDLVTRLPRGGAQLLSSAVAVAGTQVAAALCASDGTPPSAALPLLQSPPDVASTTSGPVNVTATVTDNCSGVDASQPPQLWYCVATSCAFPADYTNGGAMAPNGTAWTGAIPHGPWLPDLGRTLSYRIVNMTDLAGNRANSSIQSDPVNLFTTYTYVASAHATVGAVHNLGHAMNASEGLEATFAEGVASGASGSAALASQSAGIATSGSGWSSSSSAAGSDDVHATNTNDGRTITVPLSDPAGTPGTITRVVVQAELSISGANGDRFDLYACISTTCNTPLSILPTSQDANYTYDVTAARPGGGSWSWPDVTSLQVRVGTSRVGGTDGTWRIDDVAATVDYQPTYAMSIQANFTGVPVGNQSVELRHRNTGDTFSVEACTLVVLTACTTWTPIGSLPNSANGTTTALPLPGLAFLGGAPKLRFLGDAATTTQGLLYLDHLRIATTT